MQESRANAYHDVQIQNIWSGGLWAVLVAALLNLAVFLIGRLGFGVMFIVPYGADWEVFGPVTVMFILVASLMAPVIGTPVYAALSARARHATGIFIGLSTLLLVVSLAIPLGLPVEPGTRYTLALMHLLTVGSTVLILVRSHRAGIEAATPHRATGFRRVGDVLGDAGTAYGELAKRIESIDASAIDDTSLALVQRYLTRRERQLAETLSRLKRSLPDSVVETWYKYDPARETTAPVPNLSDQPTAEEVVDAVMALDDRLVEVFTTAAESTMSVQVAELFTNLVELETHGRRELLVGALGSAVTV